MFTTGSCWLQIRLTIFHQNWLKRRHPECKCTLKYDKLKNITEIYIPSFFQMLISWILPPFSHDHKGGWTFLFGSSLQCASTPCPTIHCTAFLGVKRASTSLVPVGKLVNTQSTVWKPCNCSLRGQAKWKGIRYKGKTKNATTFSVWKSCSYLGNKRYGPDPPQW